MSQLLVPIHVSALHLRAEEPVLRELADFTLLPHVGPGPRGPRERNSDVPFLADAVATHPFDLESIALPAGVHLHWALPDALTRARAPVSGGPPASAPPPDFAAIPNRWLVQRSGGGLGPKTWIVESDFVHLGPKAAAHPDLPPIPYPLRDPGRADQPYVLLGRQRELDDPATRTPPTPEQCLPQVDGEPLKAPGWGDPHFHAFYPTCRSVLGLYDPEPADRETGDLSYRVVGFYEGETRDGAALDPLVGTQRGVRELGDGELRQLLGLSAEETVGDEQRVAALVEAIRREYGWHVDPATLAHFEHPGGGQTIGAKARGGDELAGILCCGEVLVDAEPARPASSFELAVGNTPTEALSAYLAPKIAERLGRDDAAVEDQLEALHLTADLQHHRVDLGPKFEEARLGQAFHAVPGGALWTLREPPVPDEPPAAPKPGEARPPAPAPAVSAAIDAWCGAVHRRLAHALHLLNREQAAYDRARRVLESLRTQVFLDWSYYMDCAYRPPHAVRRDDTEGMDVVARLVRTSVLWLNVVARFTGEIEVHAERPPLRGRVRVAPGSSRVSGSGTHFDEELAVGQALWIADERVVVAAILDDDELELAAPHTAGAADTPVLRDEVLWRETAESMVAGPPFEFEDGDFDVLSAELRLRWEALHAEDATPPEGGLGGPALRAWYTKYVGLHSNEIPLEVRELLVAGLVPPGGGDPIADARGGFDDLANAVVAAQNELAQRLGAAHELFLAAHHALPDAAALERLTSAVADAPEELAAADRLAAALAPLRGEARAVATRRLADGLGRHQLQRSAAPRFWRPQEPCLLIVGEGLEASARHGQDGALETALVLSDPRTDLAGLVAELAALDGVVPRVATSSDGPHPLFLEWELAIQPADAGGNVDPSRRRFAHAFLTSNYALDARRGEFLRPVAAGGTTPSTTVVSGRSVLTPHARDLLSDALDDFVVTQTRAYLVANHPDEKLAGANASEPKVRADLLARFDADPQAVREWCDEQHQLDLVHTYVEAAQLPDEDAPREEVFRQKLLPHLPEKREEWRQFLFDEDDERAKMVLAWFGEHADARAPLEFAADARAALPHEGALQSVTLSGFNEALLMRRQGFQLPICDPLGFPHDRAFTEELVRRAVADQGRTSVVPGADFQPIRSGEVRLMELRLADTFGRFLIDRRLTQGRPDARVAAPVRKRGQEWDFRLPARITQAARMNFRWLSAADGDQEANAHPFSSPVCGWIVPNLLDSSLEVYEADGRSIGYLDESGRWRTPPGRRGAVLPEDADSVHLARVVRWISDRAREAQDPVAFVSGLAQTIERSLEHVDPEDFAHHQGIALLLGRPMAVVRAAVGMELAGLPAQHQGHLAMHRRLRGVPEHTDGFLDVDFPVRLGDPGQLGDGLIGYWLEDDAGALGPELCMPQVASGPEDALDGVHTVDPRDGRPPRFELRLRHAPRRVTMLLDPRGAVHCTTGVLPTKSISVPREHFSGVLSTLQVHFLSAPVLTGPASIELPLPTEPGHEWSWVHREGTGWRQLTTARVVSRADLEDQLPSYEGVWEALVAAGWLTPLDRLATRGTLVPPTQRSKPTLDAPLDTRAAAIADVLERIARGIVPPETGARFGADAVVREGWLQLTPVRPPEGAPAPAAEDGGTET